MTVSTVLNKITYTGDGVTTNFTFPFAMPSGGAPDISVSLTDTSGNITQLTQPSQFTVALVAPVAPNPTGVGGTVTLASPAGVSTLVTILRTLPLTQPTSLANQGTLYQPVVESMDDNQSMMIQQLNELLGRQITVAVSDPVPNSLPPAAQRAGLFMAFDGSGNPIAVAGGGANSPVSSAMAPVVAASTIAGAVALLGLSGVAPIPSGVMSAFAGSAAPAGWLLCGGQAVSRTGANTALFAAIGTQYGVGDGSTTFNLPDMRGRNAAGLDNINGIAAGRLSATTIPSGGGPTTLGGNGGTETNVVTTAKLPAHNHPAASVVTDPGHVTTLPGGGSFAQVGGTGTPTGLFGASGGNTNPQSAVNFTGITVATTTSNTGGGTPLEIVQPTICVNWIIKQ